MVALAEIFYKINGLLWASAPFQKKKKKKGGLMYGKAGFRIRSKVNQQRICMHSEIGNNIISLAI